MTDYHTLVKGVGVALVATLIIVTVVSQVGGVISASQTEQYQADLAFTDATASFDVEVGASITNISQLDTSLGDAVELDGSDDATVSADLSLPSGPPWEVCTYATPSTTTITGSQNRTVVSTADIAIWYDGSADDWRAWYYDDANRSSITLSVNATNADNRAALCLQRDADTVTLHRNSTATAATLDGTGSAELPTQAHWSGTLEETRVWAMALNSSQRTTYLSDPDLGVAGQTPRLRITYDSFAASPSSVEGYFADTTVSLGGGATIADTGIAGRAVSDSDYTLSGETMTLTGLEENGTVLYADYETKETLGIFPAVVNIGGSALGLVIVGILVIAATRVSELFGDGGM